MPNNENNNQTNNQQNNGQQNTIQNGADNFSGGGKKVTVGIDRGGGDDAKYMQDVAKGLESCGYQVTTTTVDPNQQAIMRGKGADFNVFLCNGVGAATIWSFTKEIEAGGLPHTIFAFEGWYHNADEPDGTLADLQHCLDEEFYNEHDAAQFMSASDTAQMQADAQDNNVKTVGDWFNAKSQYVSACYASTPEEMAQNICSGTCGTGTGGSGSTVSSGGGAQIKDSTFERCIRRICAATDSIFIVENNAAVLFPYNDWLAFTLQQKVDTITPDEIDPNVFSMEYNTEGFYNKVTIDWSGSDNQVEKVENNTIVNQNISTTSKLKNNEDGSTKLSVQYDKLVDKYGELEKVVKTQVADYETAQYIANALLMQYVREYNNACQCRTIVNRKYIGGTFYNVTNPSTYDSTMQYLHGYSTRIQKGEPIYFDLDFRYGPEGAEELLDYQFLTSGTGAVSSSGTMGGEAADINQLAQQLVQGLTNDMDKLNAIHDWLRQNITYSSYECSHHNKDPSECLKNKNALNCADTSNLSRALFSAAGLNAKVVKGDYHFWTVVTIGGKEYASDAVSAYHPIGDVWQPSGTAHFNDGGPYFAECGNTSCC